jgi:hypothetical protein
LFEEEEVFAVAEEGKWSSPPACSLFVLYNCIIINVYFYDINCINLTGKPFKDLPRSFTLILGLAPLNKVLGRKR